jgi:hypothetical protein
MRGLKIVCIITLAALLVLGSAGTVFAKGGPPADNPGKGPEMKGEKQGFSGNVTDVVGGNVTIATAEKGDVLVILTDDTKYKMPTVMNKWGSYNEFVTALGGNISDLEGRRVVALAGNMTETWEALKLMALPIPGTQPMHAHRAGNVTEFNEPASGNSWTGNITITDVHGATHQFSVGNDTLYRPMGIVPGNITVGSFVTVVTTGEQKSDILPMAKAIVLHENNKPED